MRFRWRQMAALLLSVGVAAHAQSIPSQTQAPALSDTALEKARAASRGIPGDLPRSLHYLVLASSKSVLSDLVAGASDAPTEGVFPVFQIRYR